MSPTEIITLIVVGALAGCLGSLLFKGKGMGLVVSLSSTLFSKRGKRNNRQQIQKRPNNLFGLF